MAFQRIKNKTTKKTKINFTKGKKKSTRKGQKRCPTCGKFR